MKRIFLFGLLLVMFSACQKSELKKPTQVNFAFDLNKNFDSGSTIKLMGGEINLANFDISGDRVVGDDIAFSRNFSEGLTIDLNGSGEIKELDFDLPQGEYSKIDLAFDIVPGQSTPALTLNGTYKITQGPIVALRFDFNAANNFSIGGENSDGNPTVILDADLGKKVKIEFDPIYWFQTLTANQMDNAVITPQQGQDVIILSETDNVALYEIVLGRMISSNRAVFE